MNCIRCTAEIDPQRNAAAGTCLQCWNEYTGGRTESVEQVLARVVGERDQARAHVTDCQVNGTYWRDRAIRRPPLKIVRIDKSLPLVEYKSADAAGIDIHARIDGGALEVDVGFELIKTGVAVEIAPGYFGDLRPRSGCTKRGLEAMVGTIDADYRGEVGVLLKVHRGQTIKHGDRIAQLVIKPVARCEIQEVEELSQTERWDRGWGSSGR